MKSLYIVLLITIAWTSSLPVQGQDSINIGTRHSLFSNILNEERMYWIYEPEKQPGEEEKDYPVLYLLDGDVFFHSVVGFTRFFASSRVSSLPPCVVVAVLNTDRTRDFTHQFGCTTGWQYSAWRYSKRWRDEGFLSFLN